ncbi:hypothetical protein OE88DRAFT_1649771 [Heliocybe sulcata]|uniref:Uncharacterized protein n=1 Tax=Heliocybe sulcata TaxID=5364 RepID=A0A5C3NGE0_9AGAM|nr:hypothetical protein OE88DRAFT_1649771 [Heliocybe sulcata]
MFLKRSHDAVDMDISLAEYTGNRQQQTQHTPLVIRNEVNLSSFRPYETPQKIRSFGSGTPTRLPVELVRELEALMVPGVTEMPPYHMRKELQLRYNVDRRIVYDWFRSKGLRAKEDRTSAIMASSSTASNDWVGHTQHRLLSIRPASCASSPLLMDATSRSSISSLRTPPSTSTPSDVSGSSPLVPENSFGSDYFSCNIVNSSSCVPVTPGQPCSVVASSNEDLHDDIEAEIYAGHIDLSDCHSYPLYCDKGQVYYQAQYTPHTVQPEFDYPSLASGPGDLPDLDLDQPVLKQEDRIAVYNSIAAAIGPALGIQESLGTYDSYMKEQSRLYYDRLVAPRTHLHTSSGKAEISTPSPSSLSYPAAGSSTDVKKLNTPQSDRGSNIPGLPSAQPIRIPNNLPHDSKVLPSLPAYMRTVSTAVSQRRSAVLPPVSMDAVLASRSSKSCGGRRHEDIRLLGGRPRTNSAGGGI